AREAVPARRSRRSARAARAAPAASWRLGPAQQRAEHQGKRAREGRAKEQEGDVDAQRAGVRVAAERRAEDAAPDHPGILDQTRQRWPCPPEACAPPEEWPPPPDDPQPVPRAAGACPPPLGDRSLAAARVLTLADG